MSHGILLGRSSAWCESAGYLGDIVCCFASLASSVTPGVPTPRRLFNLVPPSRPAQHNGQLCLIPPPPPVNTPVCAPDPPLCLYFIANRWQVGPPMVHRPPPLHHASGMPFSSFPCGRPTAPWSPTATPPPPPNGPPCLPPYVPVFSTYDGIPAQDRNPPRQYPQIICHCPRAWSMGRPLL